MDNFLLFLQQSAVADWLNTSRNLAIAFQVVHIVFFTAVLAVVVLIAMSVLGLVLRGKAAFEIVSGLRRYYRVTLILATGSGVIQALPRMVAYSNNSPFVAKQVFLVLAVILQAGLHYRLHQTYQAAGLPAQSPAGDRKWGVNEALAVLSLLCWVLTAGAGRAIGFV